MARAGGWKRWAAGAAVAGLLSGCTSVPLRADPLSREGGPAPVKLFDVEWWTGLVDAKLLEYAPREDASPALDPGTGRVVVLTRDGRVRSVAPEGKVEWSYDARTHFRAGALVHEGVVYVPGGDGTLLALDARSGGLKWKYAGPAELVSPPVLAGDKVLVVAADNTLLAVGLDGAWQWQYRREAPSGFTVQGAGAPAVREGVAYVGFSDGAVAAVNVADGTLKWERQVTTTGADLRDVDTTPALDDAGRVYVASYRDGLFALEAASGEVVWQTATAGLTSLALRGGVLFASGDQRVEAFHTDSGRSVWSLKVGERASRQATLAGDLLLVPDVNALLFVDPASGKRLMSWDPGRGVSATPQVAGADVYVVSNNGYLYALRLSGGRR